jgi:hypothetical protein
MEDLGRLYGHLVYFVAIWYILTPFDIVYGYMVYFMVIWYVVPRKIWQPYAQPFCVQLKQ